MDRATRKTTKKERFLRALAQKGTVTAAAKAAAISRQHVYKWRESDPVFAKAWDEALDEAVDHMEAEARRRAVDGVLKPVYQGGQRVGTIREYSDTLLIFLLKGAKPEKYRERSSHELTGKDGGPIEVADARERLASRIASIATRSRPPGDPGRPDGEGS